MQNDKVKLYQNINTNFQMDNAARNISNNFTLPSLASSKLGKLLELKEIEEKLQQNKSNTSTDLSYNSLSLNNSGSFKNKIRNLKKYERKLIKTTNSKDSNFYSVFYNKSLNINNNNNANLISQSQNLNQENNFVSIFSLASNTAKLNNTAKGLDLSKKGISLPLVFYPNVNSELGQKGILDLKINRVKNYLNIFSKFNSEIASYQSLDYKFNSGHNHSIKNISTILESFFIRFFTFISKPSFDISSSKVGLRIFYFTTMPHKPKNNTKKRNRKNNSNANSSAQNATALGKNKQIVTRFMSSYQKMLTRKLYNNFFFKNRNQKMRQLKLLGDLLTRIFKKPVELEMTRLSAPYTDSTVFSKVLGLLSNTVKYKTVINKLLRKAKFKNPAKMFKETDTKSLARIAKGKVLPAFLSGVKVRVGGRLLTQSVIPRRTVSIYQRGCLARGKAHFVNTARFTNKNKRGSYSITVSVANIFMQ